MEGDLLHLDLEKSQVDVEEESSEKKESEVPAEQQKSLADVILGLYEKNLKGELLEKATADELETEPESMIEVQNEFLMEIREEPALEVPLVEIGEAAEIEREEPDELIGLKQDETVLDVDQIILMEVEDQEKSIDQENITCETPRLEETVRSDYDESQIVCGTNVSAQIREVVSKHLSTEDLSQVEVHKSAFQPYKDENKRLRGDLDRIENLLASSRAERDEILIKYNALSERFDQLQKQPLDGLEETTLRNLLSQNFELKQRLDDDRLHFQKKVKSYLDGQQQQAELVQKLHSKVIQYRQKCDNLEAAINRDSKRFLDEPDTAARIFSHDLLADDSEIALIKLDEEQKRCSNLIQVNTLLREQLEAATAVNRSLASEVQTLAQEWQVSREELEARESDWRQEESSFNNYFLDEHNKLLNLWRYATQIRRECKETKGSTERDLSKFQTDLKAIINEIKNAFTKIPLATSQQQLQIGFGEGDASFSELVPNVSPTELWRRIQDLNKSQADLLVQRNELETRLDDLQSLNKQLNLNISAKENFISSLKRDLHDQEFLKETEEKLNKALSQCREENRVLFSALKDIVAQVNSVSKSGSQLNFSSDGSARNINSSVTSIKNFIENQHLELEELTDKISTNRKIAGASKEQLQESLENAKRLENDIKLLKQQLESTRKEKEDSCKEIEKVRAKWESLNDQKEQVERLRKLQADQVAELNSEIEVLNSTVIELKKKSESMGEENERAREESEKKKAEIQLCRKTIAKLETRHESLKEEMTLSSDNLSKLAVARDAAFNEIFELTNAVKKTETRCKILEIECFKLRSTETDLRAALAKIHDENEAVYSEKSDLISQVKKLTDEKIALASELSEVELEKSSLREEILRMEQEKLELLEIRENMQRQLLTSERVSATLQAENDSHVREKRELDSALASETRHRLALSEEVDSLNRQVEQKTMVLDASFGEKERLIKAGTDSEFQLANAEKEIKSLKEVIKSLKMEKNKMEMTFFKNQHSTAALKSQISQLKVETDDLGKKKQQMLARIDELQLEVDKERNQKESTRKMLEDKLLLLEKDLCSKMESAEARHREDRNHLTRENESIKSNMEILHQEAMKKLLGEKEQQSQKSDIKLVTLNEQLTVALQELQDFRNEAEQAKQHSSAAFRREIDGFKNQIQLLERDMNSMRSASDKDKREWASQAEKDRNSVGDLKHQLTTVRAQLEDESLSHEKELKDLKNLVKELEHQRNQSQHDVNTLKGKLKIAEEYRDNLKAELQEAALNLKEGNKKHEASQDEAVELKAILGTLKQEKLTSQKAQEDLANQLRQSRATISELRQDLQDSRLKISALESSNISTSNQVEKAQKLIQELEKSKSEMRKEIHSLHIKLQNYESDLIIKKQEVSDLQNRLAHEESKDEINKRDIFGHKQKLSDMETIRESLTKELTKLQRQLLEERDLHAIHERDFKNAIEGAQAKAKLHEEKKTQMEQMLTQANNKKDELLTKLNSVDARSRVLSDENFRAEQSKRNLESKLANICSALIKYVGVPNTVIGSSGMYKRMTTDRSPRHQGEYDVDVDLIQNTLQKVMEKNLNLENEKENVMAQLKHAQESINDLEMERSSVQEKLAQAQNSLSSNQLANQSYTKQLSTAEKTISTHLELIAKLKGDATKCSAANQECKEQIQKLENENNQLANQLKKLQQAEISLERDCASLKDELKKSENQATSALQAKRSHEIELQRQKMSFTDKETENQILKDRCESFMKQINDLEEKVMSSQITVERLNMTLERSVEDESELKSKLQSLNKSLTESNSSGWSLQEKIQQLQKALANSENERRALQEKTDNMKSSWQETKKSNLAFSERIQQLRIELSNYEEKIRNSEADGRNLQKLIVQHKESENENLQLIQKLQVEKHSLQDVIGELQRALTQIEVEKQDFQRWHILLEKDKSALKQTLDKVERDRLMSSEKMTRTAREKDAMDRSFTSLENEKSDLRRRLLVLEEQLSEQEKHHSQQMLNLTSRQRQEKDMEIDRLRNAQTQAEKTLELRERSHRQRVLSLEQQVQLLKDQLNQEIRKRQLYIQRSSKAADDMKGLRNVLDQSLRSVSRDSTLDSSLLQSETRKLDFAVDQHLTSSNLSPESIRRSTDHHHHLRSLASSTPLRRKMP